MIEQGPATRAIGIGTIDVLLQTQCWFCSSRRADARTAEQVRMGRGQDSKFEVEVPSCPICWARHRKQQVLRTNANFLSRAIYPFIPLFWLGVLARGWVDRVVGFSVYWSVVGGLGIAAVSAGVLFWLSHKAMKDGGGAPSLSMVARVAYPEVISNIRHGGWLADEDDGPTYNDHHLKNLVFQYRTDAETDLAKDGAIYSLERLLGENHPFVGASKLHLAELRDQEGKTAQAESLRASGWSILAPAIERLDAASAA